MLLKDAEQALGKMGRNAWPVGDSKRLHGVITLREIEEAHAMAAVEQTLIRRIRNSHTCIDHPLSLALERMGAHACRYGSRGQPGQHPAAVWSGGRSPDVLAAYGVSKEPHGKTG